MTIVTVRDRFRATTQSEVYKALEDPDPGNEISIEVARLLDGYTENFKQHVEKTGVIPPMILRKKGSCPLEEIAMELTSKTLKEVLS